jgi:hypothetical protein
VIAVGDWAKALALGSGDASDPFSISDHCRQLAPPGINHPARYR